MTSTATTTAPTPTPSSGIFTRELDEMRARLIDVANAGIEHATAENDQESVACIATVESIAIVLAELAEKRQEEVEALQRQVASLEEVESLQAGRIRALNDMLQETEEKLMVAEDARDEMASELGEVLAQGSAA